MAMMIQKFHRLIQSKIVWTAFLILVCIAFVGLYIPGMDSYQQSVEAAAAGELYGEPVSQDEFRHHYINVYLRFTLRQLRPPTITDEVDEVFRQMAWRRMVTMKKAQEMGIRASDAEVIQRIKVDPTFQQDGVYSQARYNAFVQQFLPQIGVTETQYEQYIREEMVLNKMRFLAAQSALVSPTELKERYAMIRDKFVVEYAMLTEDLVADDVAVTPEDAKIFFDVDPEPYRMPEQVRVSVVQFDVAEFLDEAEPATQEEALTFYENNQEVFSYLAPQEAEEDATPETDVEPDDAEQASEEGTDEEAEDAEQGDTPKPMERVTQPFEEVREQILAGLTKHRARVLASERATDFAVAATPLGNPNAPTFDEVATQFGRTIAQLSPITETELLPGLAAGLRFNSAAFGLEVDDPDQNVSDPLLGEDSVYVLRLDERIPSHLPEFADVQEAVTEDAGVVALQDALAEKAVDIKTSAETALREGKSFGDTLKGMGLETEETDPFTASTGALAFDYANDLIGEIMSMNAGEVTAPIPTEEGLLVAYVVSREDADPTDFATVRNQISNSLRRRQAESLYAAWQDNLLEDAGFQDLRPEQTTGDEEDPDAGTTSAGSAAKSP